MNIKTIIKSIAATALLTTAMSASAANYNIDPEHSFVQFKVKHLGVSWLVASFNDVSGTLAFDAEKPLDSAISFKVDTNSLDTNHKVRDGHLSKKSVINNADFPEATFESKSYDGTADGGVITGILSINGEEKEVSLPVTKIGEGSDPWGGYRVGFEGKLNIDRRDFGSDENYGPASWDVELDVFVEAIKAK
jgi:polyisoprenoid-binding protein YceI